MADLGAISSYALAVQNVQMAMIKNTAQTQQQMIDILFDTSDNRSVPPSDTLGVNVDVSI